MKPHVTNFKHKKFSALIDDAIQKMAQITNEEEAGLSEKITQLKTNKQNLEELYESYQTKLKELSQVLDEYERVQQASRVHLRKMQLWLKFTYPKVIKDFSE